jgi:hypothetical protein
MRYLFLALDTSTGKGDVVCQTDDPAAVATGCRVLFDAVAAAGAPPKRTTLVPGKPGAKGKPLRVISLAEDYDGVLKVGDAFPSGRDASAALGFLYSAVSIALAQAKHRGETAAVVRGVEFSYDEDIGTGN